MDPNPDPVRPDGCDPVDGRSESGLREAPGDDAAAAKWRKRSLWLDGMPGLLRQRPGLAGRLDCDVAIVGGGFTGLWTAYYLRRHQPDLRVAVVEREIAGFGASGRNGGWCRVASRAR